VEFVTNNGAIQVEVWSDIVCPWCFIGKRRMERALEALGDDPAFDTEIEIVFRPFQLDPGAPYGKPEPVADTYARKFGGPERAAEMIARVTSVADDEGLEFRLDRALRANTADAHRLLWWALARGGPSVQAALKESLMLAYFSDGVDIGDHDVLVDRAGRCGLDPDAARSMLASDEGVDALAVGLERAAENDITAVPTYVVDGRWAVPGAQDPAVFEQVFRRVAAARGEHA
jgi:predicted DsbA family dithiol-disulfide isomerase